MLLPLLKPFPISFPASYLRSACVLLLLLCVLLNSCSQARSIARKAEQANQYKKQAVAELAELSREAAEQKQGRGEQGIRVRIATSKGDIEALLAFRLAALATASFLFLAELPESQSVSESLDSRSYIGNSFQRPKQWPDSQDGDSEPQAYVQVGRQGAIPPFPAEFSEWLRFSEGGVLAFLPSRKDQNANDSKFIITLSPQPQFFGQFTAFGRIQKGMEIVQALGAEDQIKNIEAWAEGSDGEKFLQELCAEGMSMLQKLRGQIRYQRQGMAAIHQRLARDFSTVQWPRYQQQKLQKPQQATDIMTTSYLQRMRDYGLEYKVFDEGQSGKRPLGEQHFQQVQFQYAAWATQNDARSLLLHDGIKEQQGNWVQMEQLFPAWQAALLDMRPGEKRLYLMPPEGVYGIHGKPPNIPPWSYLIMELYFMDAR